MKKVIRFSLVLLLPMGLAGCYYPVYPAYPYAYAPAPVVTGPPECHAYTQSAMIEGKKQQLTGTVCRQPDGSWKDPVNGLQIDMSAAPKNPNPPPAAPAQL